MTSTTKSQNIEDNQNFDIKLWYPIFFSIGIILYFWAHPYINLKIIIFIPIILSFCLFFHKKIFKYEFWLIPLLFISLGVTLISIRSYHLNAPIIKEKTDTVWIKGKVLSVENYQNTQRIIISPIELWGINKEDYPKKIRLKLLKDDSQVLPNDIIKTKGLLSPLPNNAYPENINPKFKFYFEQIGALGKATGKVIIEKSSASPARTINKIRKNISEKIDKILPPDISGIAKSLICGDKSGISNNIINDYRNSGLAHMLSISGLHMGLVAFLAFFSIRFLLSLIPLLSLRFDTKMIASIFSLLSITFYLFISGGEIPARRAFFMAFLAILALILARKALSLRVIMFIAFFILLINPESVISVSFGMSFIAAISLIGAYEKGWFDFNKMPFLSLSLKERILTRSFKTSLKYFLSIVLTGLIAGLSVMPFSIYYFGYFQSYSLLSNFISTPILGLIVMPFGLISLLLMPLGLEKYPLLLTGYGIEKINNIANLTADLPFSSILTNHMPPLALILISLGILWIYLSNYKPFLIGFLIIICGIFIHFNYKSPDIIISGKGELIAINSDKGLLPNLSRKERYARKIWLKAFGQKKPAGDYKDYWIKDNKYKDLEGNIKFKCNEDYCTYKNNDYKAYILEKETALTTICQDADIIISRINILNKCAKDLKIIDKTYLKSNGTTAIWLNKKIKIKSSE